MLILVKMSIYHVTGSVWRQVICSLPIK